MDMETVKLIIIIVGCVVAAFLLICLIIGIVNLIKAPSGKDDGWTNV